MADFPEPFYLPDPERTDPPDVQLIDAMIRYGIKPPDQIIMDGALHRFNSENGSKRGDLNGWYAIYNDSTPAGVFGCWKMGVNEKFIASIGRELTSAEIMAQRVKIEAAMKIRDEEKRLRHAEAAESAEKIWMEAAPASENYPYLVKKGIRPNGARVHSDGRLVLPLYSESKELATIQYIDPEGDKRFHTGGQASGVFWMIGSPSVESDPLYLAEGFATAATIYQTTGKPCAVAYTSVNLPKVAGSLRNMYGIAKKIIIVADNDTKKAGEISANKASTQYGVHVILIPIEGMDANDYLQSGHDLLGLLTEGHDSAIIEKMKVVYGNDLSDQYKPPDELIEGIMTVGGSVVLYGDSNSGKTFWALSVAAAVAEGVECYGRKVDQGFVIYLACEAPESIKSRLQAIKRYHGYKLENIAIVPVPLNFYENSGRDAVDVIELVREIETARNAKVKLIIGDTLARMSAGANENSGEDMGPIMGRFDQISSATGATMLIIHHNGKDSAKGSRGWSGIRAHIDTEIEVTEKNEARAVNITKQRELPGKGDTIYFKLEVIEMGVTKFGKTASTCVAVPDLNGHSNDKPKKEPEIQLDIKKFTNAWVVSGMELYSDEPYLTRSALHDYLMQNDGLSESTADTYCKPSAKGRLIYNLLGSEIIKAAPNGWVVCDSVAASAMMILRGEK